MTIYYSTDHEWVRLDAAPDAIDDSIATIGISNFAQEQLGDIVFVELPAVGTQIASKDSAAVVESVKAASDVYSPIAGEVIEVNNALADDPALVNQDPEGEGWFFKVRLADKSQLDELMNTAAYQQFCNPS